MIAGIVLSGMLLGTVTGGIALAMGMSFWMALLMYSGVGMAGLMAGATVLMHRTPGHATSESPLPLASSDH